MINDLFCSAKIKKEIMLKAGLRTVDSHEVEEVDALLDSEVTGLLSTMLGCAKRKSQPCKLEHPIEVYNVDRSVNRGGSIIEEVTLIL